MMWTHTTICFFQPVQEEGSVASDQRMTPSKEIYPC